MKGFISRLKFFIKISLIHSMRSFFLAFFGSPANQIQWEKRLLIVNLEAIGDLVIFTSVLKNYKKIFPHQKIFLLTKSNSGLNSVLSDFVDEVINVDYRLFSINPFYSFSFINQLRRIGFETVINHDPAAAEVIGKIISISLKAKTVVGYEGFGVQFHKPFDSNMAANIKFVQEKIYPRFTKIIPSIDKKDPPAWFLKNVISHHRSLQEGITNQSFSDYSPHIPSDDFSDKKILKWLSERNISKDGYLVVNLGSSQSWKNWPVRRFAEVLSGCKLEDKKIVLIGSPKEKHLSSDFKAFYSGDFIDAIGEFSIPETISLIKYCFLVFSNDTSPVHIAVALKKPNLCVLGGGHFGKISLYGYPDINHWVYIKRECFGDGWQCARHLSGQACTPCLDAISPSLVLDSLSKLIEYLNQKDPYPKQPFKISYLK